MSRTETRDFMFFESLARFGRSPAIIDTASAETTSYAELELRVEQRMERLGSQRSLVFMEAKNDLHLIVDYLACLRCRHVVHLLDDMTSAATRALIDLYRPNLLVDRLGTIERNNPESITLHPDVALLLSTSGSTGSPKFVKLSRRNLDANARSIRQYLELSPSERALQHLKPHYSYGLSIINSHLSAGAVLLLTPSMVLEEAFWRQLDAFEATSFAGVPYTFETLLHGKFNPADHPSLRYVTQAGGKLEARLVKAFAERMSASGKRFYVMYGQTEAAPRISYLPPELVTQYPDSIGRAIPGGELYVIDGSGQRVAEAGVVGELVYEGPNVMMGYATHPTELSSDQTPRKLLTGDIARGDPQGLFYIVGRSSRFVKPFGVRVNLDEVQTHVKERHPATVVTGTDQRIVVAMEGLAAGDPRPDLSALADRFGLPVRMFQIKTYDKLPLLPNGKFDYQRMLTEPDPAPKQRSILRRTIDCVVEVLGLAEHGSASVRETFASILGVTNISGERKFTELAADSLSFVSLAVELEQLFGDDLPANWQDIPVDELEARYQGRAAA